MTTVAPPVTASTVVALGAFAAWFGFVWCAVRLGRRLHAWIVSLAITAGRPDAR